VVTDRKLAVDDGDYDPATGTYTTMTPDGDVDYYVADVVSQSDYFPFGMMMPGRNEDDGSNYRYLFNGKEHDPETYGNGNIYDYGFRIYNPRLGKFLSMDPLTDSYPWLTPYQFANNKPIIAIDLDGLEEFTVVAQGAAVPDPMNPNQLIQPVVVYWDITARNRPMVDATGTPIPNSSQAGTIQYVDAQGVSNDIRPMTPNEQAKNYIADRLAVTSGSMQERVLMDNPNTTMVNPTTGYSQTKYQGLGEHVTNLELVPPPPLAFTPNFVPNTPTVANPATLTAQATAQAPNINRALAGSPTNMVNVQANGNFGPGATGATVVAQPGGGTLTINQIMAGRSAAVVNALVAAGVPRARINILPPNINSGVVNVNVSLARNNTPNLVDTGNPNQPAAAAGSQPARRNAAAAGTATPATGPIP
jgi:RHS repeat-associated protein